MKHEINGKELKASDLTLRDIWNILDYLNAEAFDWLNNEIAKHGTARLERCTESLQQEAVMLLDNAALKDPEAYIQLMEYLAETHG